MLIYNECMNYDVIIIGSGPAGLFAAYTLIEKGIRNVLIADRNKFPSGGLLNDCKLNLTSEIGMDLNDLFLTKSEADDYISYIDKIFLDFDASRDIYGTDSSLYAEWSKRAERNDVQLIPAKQRHIGTDMSKQIINKFRDYLESMGVSFLLDYDVSEIRSNTASHTVSDGKESHTAGNLIIAPGRNGSKWLREVSESLGIEFTNGKRIDVGIRLEMKRESYPITDILYDPKFKIKTSYSTEVRTFCTNPGGRVRLEHYDQFKLINGDALKGSKTENTNFALLNTIELTEPLTDPFVFGRLIASMTNILGGGKPVIQRVGDFLDEKRSKMSSFYDSDRWFDKVKPTLAAGSLVEPGDIRMVYPYKIVKSLKEAMIKLNKIFDNTVLKEENLIYAPEIKFYSLSYNTDRNMMTNLRGIYVAGDGAGKSRGIVGAAISGIIAAKGIAEGIK